MARMKALKTFKVGDSETGQVVTAGQEFETGITSYESRGMAVPVGKPAAKRAAPTEAKANKAADAGPLPSRGGRTGAMTSQSLSRPARAPRKSASRKPKGKRA